MSLRLRNKLVAEARRVPASAEDGTSGPGGVTDDDVTLWYFFRVGSGGVTWDAGRESDDDRRHEDGTHRIADRMSPGGTAVCAGSHTSDIPRFSYELLWGERTVRSVANLTRADGDEFLALAPTVPVRTEVDVVELAQANAALDRLRAGRLRGAAVVVPRDPMPLAPPDDESG